MLKNGNPPEGRVIFIIVARFNPTQPLGEVPCETNNRPNHYWDGLQAILMRLDS